MLTEKDIQVMFSEVSSDTSGKAVKLFDDWTYSAEFRHFQKVNEKVYVYVTPQYGRFIAQMYLRGETGACSLEARVPIDLQAILLLFNLAEHWLIKYGQDSSHHTEDIFYPFLPNGAWQGQVFMENPDAIYTAYTKTKE